MDLLIGSEPTVPNYMRTHRLIDERYLMAQRFAVVNAGSMAKAAAHLKITQPSVSKAISDLESVLGVRLFDRSSHGVAPTIYGDALLKCRTAVFDELKQGSGASSSWPIRAWVR